MWGDPWTQKALCIPSLHNIPCVHGVPALKCMYKPIFHITELGNTALALLLTFLNFSENDLSCMSAVMLGGHCHI